MSQQPPGPQETLPASTEAEMDPEELKLIAEYQRKMGLGVIENPKSDPPVINESGG